MEKSQHLNNFFVKYEEFARLEFASSSKELPGFMIDFVDYLLG